MLGLARSRTAAREQDRLMASIHSGRPDAKQVRLTTTADGEFWEPARVDGTIVAPQIAELIGKHRWRSQPPIRAGDIVLDCGANIGTFTRDALKRGAKRVIAFEPAVENIECFRRNLREEIASGKVVLIEKGVWNEDTTLRFFIDSENSAQNSFVVQNGRKYSVTEVSVTTIDKAVASLGLPRVDLIKMDIEGGEPQALQGALATLNRFRPKLELEVTGNPQRLIEAARRGWPGYKAECLLCFVDSERRRLLVHDLWLSPH